MKLNVFISAVALLGAFQPRYECRAIETGGGAAHPSKTLETELQQLSLPIILRLGEEYLIRLDKANQNDDGSPSKTVNRALQLQLTQQLLQGKVDNIDGFISSYKNQVDDFKEKGKRSEEPPISLDLTFHLLREVLEMARAEQIAQQANSNRRMMDIFGK